MQAVRVIVVRRRAFFHVDTRDTAIGTYPQLAITVFENAVYVIIEQTVTYAHSEEGRFAGTIRQAVQPVGRTGPYIAAAIYENTYYIIATDAVCIGRVILENLHTPVIGIEQVKAATPGGYPQSRIGLPCQRIDNIATQTILFSVERIVLIRVFSVFTIYTLYLHPE